MAAAMPGEKGHAVSLELADDERIRWRAEWRIDAQLARPGQPRHGVEAAAADDPDAHGLLADRFASRLLPASDQRLFHDRTSVSPAAPARLRRPRCVRANAPPAPVRRGRTTPANPRV